MAQNRHRGNRPSQPSGGNGQRPAFSGAEAFLRAGTKPTHTIYSTCVHADRLVSLAKRVEKFNSDLNYKCGRGFFDYTKFRRAQDELFTAIAIFQSTFEKIQNGIASKGNNSGQNRPQHNVGVRPQQSQPQKPRPAAQGKPAAPKPPVVANKPAGAPTPTSAKPTAATAPAKPTTTPVAPKSAAVTPAAPTVAAKPAVTTPVTSTGNGKAETAKDAPQAGASAATNVLKKTIAETDAKIPAESRFSRITAGVRKAAAASKTS